MFQLSEIRKYSEGLHFEKTFFLQEALMSRNPEILEIGEISAVGSIICREDLYILHYQLSYQICLASSRSLQPIWRSERYEVQEIFSEQVRLDVPCSLEEEIWFPIENEEIDLTESVADNILLHIPLKILTAEEEKEEQLPSGSTWQVLTEERYKELQACKHTTESPFSHLRDLLDKEQSKK